MCEKKEKLPLNFYQAIAFAIRNTFSLGKLSVRHLFCQSQYLFASDIERELDLFQPIGIYSL